MKRAQPGEGRGLGLFLKQRKGATGLVVASLQEGGAAERSGKVIVGDRVIAVSVQRKPQTSAMPSTPGAPASPAFQLSDENVADGLSEAPLFRF